MDNKKPMDIKSKVAIISVIGLLAMLIMTGMESEKPFDCSGKDAYKLQNDDGTLNMDYYHDMQVYFQKHPDQLPK